MVALWILVVDVLHAAPRALPSPIAIATEPGFQDTVLTLRHQLAEEEAEREEVPS